MLCINIDIEILWKHKTPHVPLLARQDYLGSFASPSWPSGIESNSKHNIIHQTMADTKEHAEEVIRFKKRRKITHQRRRKCDVSDDESTHTPSLEATELLTFMPSEAPMSVTEILRKRQAEQSQRKLKSVVQASSRDQRRHSDTPAMEQEGEQTIVDIARGRFVPETGKIFTLDKQM